MILRVKSVARQSFVSISSLLLISRIISEKRRERQELRERGIISTLVTDGERWEDGGRQDTARVGRIRSDRDWITCSCLPAIVCSMPITNMPALNFQLVSLNCANTAAPVPASRVAERFLFSRYIASLSLSRSPCLVFVIERSNNSLKRETVPFPLPRVRNHLSSFHFLVKNSSHRIHRVFVRNVGHPWRMDSLSRR